MTDDGPAGLEDPRAPWEESIEDPAAPRALLAVMFTDIVGSTELATALGDKRWRELLEQHDTAVREQIARFEGREVDTAGDAFFATFGRPVQAVDCALESARAVRRLGLRIRAGIHMGECVVTKDKVRGVTVHIGARVGAKARGDEVLVSSTVRDTLVGQELSFSERGEQMLKGVEGKWRLYAVEPRVRDNEADLPPLLETHIPPPPPPAWKKPRVLIASAVALALLAGAITFVITRGGGLSSVPADSLAAIDASSGEITEAIRVGRRPVGVAAGRDGVWVANSIDGTASHIASDGQIRRTGVLGAGPAGIAIGPTTVWIANLDGRSISRVDPSSAREVEGGSVTTGNGLSGITYGAGAVWISNAVDGTVWKIEESSGKKMLEIPVGPELRDIAAVDDAVWVASETAGTVTQLNPSSGSIVRVVQVGNGARAVAVGAGAVWVANAFDGTVSRIDPNDGRITNTIAVGRQPRAMAIGRGQVFVANELDGTISMIDAASRRLTRTISVGSAPMALAADGDRVWMSVRGGPLRYRGGTLRFGTSQEVATLDPAFMWDDVGFAIVPATHDTLVSYKKVGGVEGGVVLPNLAEELLPPTDEGRTYSFTLQPGLRYSNGTAVQASDIRKSLERMFLADATSKVFYGAIKGADACSPERCDLSQGVVTDDRTRTVTFHLQRAVPDFPYQLAHPMGALVPPGTPPKDVGITAVPGTGPYAVTSAEGDSKGGRAVLERNPHFRSRGAARPEGYPDRIILSWGGSPAGHLDAVKEGSEDWAIAALEDDVDPARVATEIPAQFHVFEQQSVFFATLNQNIPPLDDVRVRRAINYAVDRRALTDHVGGPILAGATCQVFAKNLLGYQPYCPYTKDPTPAGNWTAPDLATARRLVRESGTRGQRITIWTPPFEFFEGAAAIVADALGAIGYRPTIRQVPNFIEDFQGVAAESKAFQMLLLGWFVDYPSPSNFVMPVLMCPAAYNEFAGLPDASANVANFCSPDIDRMTLRALAVQQDDPLRSADLWAEIDRTLTDAAPWVSFATRRVATIVSSRVGNVLYNPTLGPLITQMWLTDRK